MAITLKEAKALRPGQYIHSLVDKNTDGTPVRFKINGQPKIWKRSPERVKVPLKYGLWGYYYLTEDDLDSVGMGDGR